MRKFIVIIFVISLFFIGYIAKSYIDRDLQYVVYPNPLEPLDIETYDGGGGRIAS